jgi:hypothetical protein
MWLGIAHQIADRTGHIVNPTSNTNRYEGETEHRGSGCADVNSNAQANAHYFARSRLLSRNCSWGTGKGGGSSQRTI